MSESEGFLSRWSRLKQQSRREDVAPEAGELQADLDATPVSSVDLTSLPDIDSIGPDSDIRPFLQAGVPQELTGAALRNAWVADPSIRDFVEVADNQWDFNAESGIPGFGALGSTEYARHMVARALAGLDEAQPELPSSDGELSLTAPTRSTAVPGPQIIDEVWKTGAADVGGAVVALGVATGNEDGQAVDREPAAEDTGQPVGKRAHGTALPK